MRPRRKSVVIARTQIRASLRGLGLSLRDDSDDSASNSSSKISQSRSPSHSPAAKRSRIDAISNAPSGVVPTQAQSQASESVSSTMRPNEQTRQRRRKANRTGFDRPTSNVNQVPLNAPNANPPQPSTSTSAMAAASTSAATTTTTKKPLKRPNEMRAKRGETENKDLEQFTVVMTLNQFLRDEKVFPDKQRLTDLIERVVANSSRMFKLASLYVLFILNRLVDNGSDVEIRREFLAKFNANKYFRALKKTPLHTPAYILDNEFRDFLIENDIETKLDLDNANQVLKFAIEQYDRNAKLIVKMHMRRYMRRYFKNLGATKHQINKTMDYLCDRNSTCRPNANLLNRYLEELKPLVPPQVVQPQRRRRQTPPRRGPQSGRGRRRGRQQRQQRQRGRRGRQQQPLPVPRGWLFETHSKFDWYKYVYELLNLQRVIHAHNATNPHRNWSSFVAVPQSSNAKHHARFDTDGFILLTNLLYEARTGQKIPMPRDPWTHAQHNAFWRRFVNLDKINKPSQQFDFSFTTDGCSAHLKMIRRTRNVNTNTNNNNNNDDAVPNPEQPDPVPPIIQRAYDSGQIERIIGCDPGYREFVGVVRKDLATDNEENFLKSSKEWHHMTGFFDRQYKLKRFTGEFEKKCRKLRENREMYEEMPSKKSADYRTYLDYQLDIFNESCEIKYQKRVVRLKFDAYTRTQVALHVLVKQMTKVDRRMSDAEKTVILAFGGAKFASNSPIKGYLRCPHRALQQMAREYVFVLPINEHNTSQKCSRSGRKLKKRRSVPERQSKDRFLVCPNCKPVEDGVFHDPIQWTGRVHRTFKKKHPKWKYRSICTFHRPVPEAEANPNPPPRQKKKRYQKQLERKTTVIFNRDINAARNMIKKGLYMLNHLPMPNCFRPFRHQLHYYYN